MPRFYSHVWRLPRQSLGAVLLVLAVTLAWTGAASASRGASSPDRAATALITPTAAQVTAVSAPAVPGDPFSELQASLMARYPTSFGGLYVNKAGQFVVATAGPPTIALQQFVTTGFGGAAKQLVATRPAPAIRMAYANTGVTLQHLYDLKAAILDNPVLTKDGVDGAGLDIEHGRVVVMSRTKLGASAVEADYGSAVKVLLDDGSGLFADRYGDTPAFNGGDQIVTPSDGETTCTSGFGMQDTTTGRTYLLTAGHCGNATWYSTHSSDPVYNSSTLIGSTVPGSVVTSVIDAQLISTEASCISWGGISSKVSNDERIYITGYTDPLQGAAIETEGSVSTEETGTVAYYDVSKVLAGESLQDLDFITVLGVGGDSGGPMIYPTIYGPLAGGTDVGWFQTASEAYGVIQLIDAEVFTYSAFMGDQVVPVTSSTGYSC
jgi:hypothetical protein